MDMPEKTGKKHKNPPWKCLDFGDWELVSCFLYDKITYYLKLMAHILSVIQFELIEH